MSLSNCLSEFEDVKDWEGPELNGTDHRNTSYLTLLVVRLFDENLSIKIELDEHIKYLVDPCLTILLPLEYFYIIRLRE